MPLVTIKLIENVFNDEQKQQMIDRVTDAMLSIEGHATRHLGPHRRQRQERGLGHWRSRSHGRCGARHPARQGSRAVDRLRPLAQRGSASWPGGRGSGGSISSKSQQAALDSRSDLPERHEGSGSRFLPVAPAIPFRYRRVRQERCASTPDHEALDRPGGRADRRDPPGASRNHAPRVRSRARSSIDASSALDLRGR